MINLKMAISHKYITTVSILILYFKTWFSYGDVFENRVILVLEVLNQGYEKSKF